jgi:hypothetical protein
MEFDWMDAILTRWWILCQTSMQTDARSNETTRGTIMSTIPDGGPAFPGMIGEEGRGHFIAVNGPGGTVYHAFAPGMSLRDHFAGEALKVVMANSQSIGEDYNHVAIEAFRYADAMIRQRSKTTES